jgi:hypothetical protein
VRTQAINLALESAISRQRLEKYLAANGDDLDLALRLYERNLRLSEAFYVPLQSLEVCLRNIAHNQMSATYGPDWLTDQVAAPLNDFSRSMVNEAVREIDGAATAGKIVAELKFAFWVGLMSHQYDNTLWRSAMHRCFRASGSKKRAVVHGRLNAIRRFRNRVAHHEPIFHKRLDVTHGEVIEALGWMCRDTQAWTAHLSRVPEVLNSN